MKFQMWIAIAIAALIAGGSAGCREERTAEKLGRQLDEAAGSAADAIDEAAGNAADAIDEAADEAKKKLE